MHIWTIVGLLPLLRTPSGKRVRTDLLTKLRHPIATVSTRPLGKATGGAVKSWHKSRINQ